MVLRTVQILLEMRLDNQLHQSHPVAAHQTRQQEIHQGQLLLMPSSRRRKVCLPAATVVTQFVTTVLKVKGTRNYAVTTATWDVTASVVQIVHTCTRIC